MPLRLARDSDLDTIVHLIRGLAEYEREIQRRLCGTPGRQPTAQPICAGAKFFMAAAIPSAILPGSLPAPGSWPRA